jgi:hypothetical protein
VSSNHIVIPNARAQPFAEKSDIPESAVMQLEKFLSFEDQTLPFHIQGWRWHLLSLQRDSARLSEFAVKMGSSFNGKDRSTSLKKAVEHVLFNFKALQRIENQTFFPWMREKLMNKKLVGDVAGAFSVVLDSLDEERQKVSEIASMIRNEVELVENNGVGKLVDLSKEMAHITKSIQEKQDRFIVPALSKVVSSREQKAFNNKVLRKLGLLESRIHLVGMHDAVHDKRFGNDVEKQNFEAEIPSVAKMMINRWRRTLYQPQAGMLDEF